MKNEDIQRPQEELELKIGYVFEKARVAGSSFPAACAFCYLSVNSFLEALTQLTILYIIYTVYKLHNICRCFFKTDRYAFLFWLSKEQAHRS